MRRTKAFGIAFITAITVGLLIWLVGSRFSGLARNGINSPSPALNASASSTRAGGHPAPPVDPPRYDARRLTKGEVETLLDAGAGGQEPVVFGSYQGVHHCCDLGEPNLQFLPGRIVRAFGDGFVPWQERSTYNIADDGKIVLSQALRESFDGYLYRYGENLYLAKSATVTLDVGFESGTRWPFKRLPATHSPDSSKVPSP